MSRKAAAAGIPMALSIPAGNLMHPPREDRSLFQERSLAEAYGRALFLLEAKRWQGAQEALSELTARRPDAALFRYQLGRASIGLKQWDESRRHLELVSSNNLR